MFTFTKHEFGDNRKCVHCYIAQDFYSTFRDKFMYCENWIEHLRNVDAVRGLSDAVQGKPTLSDAIRGKPADAAYIDDKAKFDRNQIHRECGMMEFVRCRTHNGAAATLRLSAIRYLDHHNNTVWFGHAINAVGAQYMQLDERSFASLVAYLEAWTAYCLTTEGME